MNPSKAPLEALEDLINSARRIPSAAEIWSDDPPPTDGDPLEILIQRVRGVIPQHAAPAASAQPPQSPKPSQGEPRSSSSDNLDALLGEEVLRALASRPLPGPARAEALRLLLPLLTGPEAHRLRPLLEILLFGSPGDTSTT